MPAAARQRPRRRPVHRTRRRPWPPRWPRGEEGHPHGAVAPQLPPHLPRRPGQARQPGHRRAAADRRPRPWGAPPARPLTAEQLAAQLSTKGRTATTATIDRALAELAVAGAAAGDAESQRWTLRPAAQHPLLAAVDLHGAHDFRHTFSTWLEDAGIPARVIDELMGHQASGRAGRHPGSAIGAHYRHTTPEMAARVVGAVEERLAVVLATAEAALDRQPW
jgi:hypothetical protein